MLKMLKLFLKLLNLLLPDASKAAAEVDAKTVEAASEASEAAETDARDAEAASGAAAACCFLLLLKLVLLLELLLKMLLLIAAEVSDASRDDAEAVAACSLELLELQPDLQFLPVVLRS